MNLRKQSNYARRIPLRAQYAKSKFAQSRIVISTQGQYNVVEIEDILYLKSDSNYTHVYLKDGQHFICSITMKRFQEYLSEGDFLRVHNQYIVHGKYLKSYHTGLNQIELQGLHKIPVSRNRKAIILDYLKNHLLAPNAQTNIKKD